MTEQVLEVRPVTPDRWDELHALFGDRGASGNCWCMFWRVTSSEFDAGIKGANRRGLKRLVADGAIPGLLAFADDVPVGWCSVAQRSEFGRIDRSPTLKPVDDAASVWSLVCFYIDRRHRRGGVGAALLDAAVEHTRARGAGWLEAYPIDSAVKGDIGAAGLFTGTLSMFERAGFKEVARRSPARPMVRKRLD